jgi:hypothetical protein
MKLRESISKIWRTMTTTRLTRAIEDEILPHLRAQNAELIRVRSENDRLRAENRALLDSILGIAGIPPVIVAEPSNRGCHPEPTRDLSASSACAGRDAKERFLVAKDAPRNDRQEFVVRGSQERTPGTAPLSEKGRARTKNGARAPRGGNGGKRDANVIAPMRRRSWPQVNRALEVAALRKRRNQEEMANDR